MALDLSRAGLGELMADALAGDVAGELVQIQGWFQALLAGHLPVSLYLHVQGRFRCHNDSLGVVKK